MMSQPWYHVNPSPLGPERARTLADFPTGTDSLLYLMMKAIALFTRDAAMTINFFYLLTFPLTALAMLFAARWILSAE